MQIMCSNWKICSFTADNCFMCFCR